MHCSVPRRAKHFRPWNIRAKVPAIGPAWAVGDVRGTPGAAKGHLLKMIMNGQESNEALSSAGSAAMADEGGRVVFQARGLTKTYRLGDVEVRALRGVDLDLYSGEFVVLLGPSGSGKSTLLNLLGGLDVPTGGQVWFRGGDLTKLEDRALTRYRREHVGFVFQFYNLIPSLTARENVALITEIASNPMAPDEALGWVGLNERLDHFPSQLSGGEQQRVAIARAVAKRPDVLLCDEPTGALDVTTGVRVLEVLERINRDLGTTTAVITHNAVIASMADRVVSLSDGRIAGVRSNERRCAPRELVW
jgi:putative ABC transport system ATP-binding protein